MCRGRFHRQADAERASGGWQTEGRGPPVHALAPNECRAVPLRQAAFAFVAYMSTYSCPDSRITSAITESVTARST
ncbi:hypothetical protein SAMN05216533_6958 [Streptomyces sp. Ag109_O5-10]|nr:hypothetical protein SAMN05216533_6958 [Streptomyces sp. Ag109_O5-10]